MLWWWLQKTTSMYFAAFVMWPKLIWFGRAHDALSLMWPKLIWFGRAHDVLSLLVNRQPAGDRKDLAWGQGPRCCNIHTHCKTIIQLISFKKHRQPFSFICFKGQSEMHAMTKNKQNKHIEKSEYWPPPFILTAHPNWITYIFYNLSGFVSSALTGALYCMLHFRILSWCVLTPICIPTQYIFPFPPPRPPSLLPSTQGYSSQGSALSTRGTALCTPWSIQPLKPATWPSLEIQMLPASAFSSTIAPARHMCEHTRGTSLHNEDTKNSIERSLLHMSTDLARYV